MGKSQILGIDELAQGQTQAYTVVNDAVAALEESINAVLPITTDLPTYEMEELDFVRYGSFEFSGMTANRNVLLPATIEGNTTYRASVYIINLSTQYSLTVSSGGGSTVVVPAGAVRNIMVKGTVVRTLGEAGKITGVEHSVAVFAGGLPNHDTEVLRYIFTEAVTWPTNLTGTRGTVGTPPSPGAGFYFYKNGSQVGRALVSSGGAFTFVSSAPISWAVGDVLTVKFQALEIGTIVFNAVADTNDTITVDNGTDSPVVFTFGGGGGQVAPGATATDSASAFQLALQASAIASSVFVERTGTTVRITNLLPARGGSLAKSDADNDYTITDFNNDASSENYGITFSGTRG